jgi:hypothetical protein
VLREAHTDDGKGEIPMIRYFIGFLELPSCAAYLHWDWVNWLIHQRYFNLDGLIEFTEPGEPWQW